MTHRRRCWLAVLLCVIALAPPVSGAAEKAVVYSVLPADARQSLLRVTIKAPPGATEFQLPVWNALYQVREFSQYVRNVTARDEQEKPLAVRKVDKSTWRVSGARGPVFLEYEVAAVLPGPYGAQFTAEHAFLNLAVVLMYPVQARASPVALRFVEFPHGWRFATSLQPEEPSPDFVGFSAPSYDALVDAPIEIGAFRETWFEEGGARYRIVVHADPADYDLNQLAQTVRNIVRAANQWMNDAPLKEYVFLYHFPRGRGGGGMEHAFSTAIEITADRLRQDWLSLAGLTAHEFIHLWNVKRIRPQSLEPVDYTRENYTTSLWFSEGVSSTVEDLILVRAGLLDEQQFLSRLARQIRTLQGRPARLAQSAEESSLDTWLDKYAHYRLPERSISYYNKGQILGVLLDLKMREATDERKSLRDLFQFMNDRYARQGKFFADSEGVRAAAESLTGADFSAFFRDYVSGVKEIPYDEFFARVGLKLAVHEDTMTSAGFTAGRNFDSPPIVLTVDANSQAARAGLAPGDLVLTFNDRPAPTDLNDVIEFMKPGEQLRLRISGRNGAREVKLRLTEKKENGYVLTDVEKITPAQRARRAAWLGLAMQAASTP